MKVLNIGSMNLDHVYSVDHIILPGETEATGAVKHYLGGKGMNQSVALAKAGVEVYQGGMIGEDGQPFLDACKEYGVHGEYIAKVDDQTGHTIIQIDKNAQNSILLYGGANQRLTQEYVDGVLSHFDAGDILLLQNEVNMLPYIVEKAFEKGMQIALNPSPFNEKLDAVDMTKISIFLLNEVEGNQVTGKTDPDEILAEMRKRFPKARIVLTLGKDGAVYSDGVEKVFQPIFPVKAVDTTAAGDTFTGYFLAGLAEGMPVAQALRMSARASAIAVSRPGAVPSIPLRKEVEEALANS
ncbi:MAG: ribokinase [Fibrobacter sp.]|nr:ribokinase [Fibrobacter sp.]